MDYKYVLHDRDYHWLVERVEKSTTIEELREILKDLLSELNLQSIPNI